MPMPYTMPSIPNRYPLDKNDKLGLLIGTLLSGGLAAAGSKNTGESPWLRGVAGATAGFGAGGKAINDSYSAMLDDYLKNEAMDYRNRQMTQEQQQFQDTLGLKREEFETSEKPYKKAMSEYLGKKETFPAGMGRMNEYAMFNGMSPEEQTKYLDYLSKTGYNRVLGMDETGNPVFVPTRGNVQLKTPPSPNRAGTQTPPVSGKDIQPFVKPVLAESAQENIARGDTLQQNINRVKGLYDKTFVGAGDALQGKAGEIYGKATDDKEKNFRSAVNSLYTNMFAEGGKALTENEKEILKPLFPSFWRGEENFLIDLGGLETKYRELMQARLQTHKDAGMRNIDNVQKGLTSPINQPQTADDFINLLEGK